MMVSGIQAPNRLVISLSGGLVVEWVKMGGVISQQLLLFIYYAILTAKKCAKYYGK